MYVCMYIRIYIELNLLNSSNVSVQPCILHTGSSACCRYECYLYAYIDSYIYAYIYIGPFRRFLLAYSRSLLT